MRPIVLERADKYLMGLDLASKLMQDRIIMLDDAINNLLLFYSILIFPI